MVLPGALASCSDGVRNGGEAGVDCGGSCSAQCSVSAPHGDSHRGSTMQWPLFVGLLVAVSVVVTTVAVVVMRRRRRLARDRVSPLRFDTISDTHQCLELCDLCQPYVIALSRLHWQSST